MYLIDSNYTNQSMQYMANTLGNSQIQNNSELIKVYPNPANNSLYINLALDSEANIKLQILSIEGRLVFDKNINSNSFNNIDISKIEKGVYFIKIVNNGNVLYKDKLIKL